MSSALPLIGPDFLPPGNYKVEIHFKCRVHRGVTMAVFGRRTVPVPFVHAAGIQEFSRPNQANDQNPKVLAVCSKCPRTRRISLAKAQAGVDVLWEPWARRVVTQEI